MLTKANATGSAYEPYQSVTDIQLTLGQTIYGGTLDVEKGILTVDRGIKSAKWGDWKNKHVLGDTKRSTITFDTVSNVNGYDGGIESVKTNVASYYYWNVSWDNIHYYIETVNNVSMCYMFLPVNFDDNTDVQVVYPLATPFTIQLTPHEISLLKDYAYVSTNGTNMSFSYKNGEMASLGDVAQLGETVNELGDVVANSVLDSENIDIEETTVPTSTFTTIYTFTAPMAGKYILNAKVDIADTSSDSALRILIVSTNPNAENTNISEYVLNTGRCVSEITRIVTLSAGDTLYIRYYQTTGSSQVAYGRFRYMKF